MNIRKIGTGVIAGLVILSVITGPASAILIGSDIFDFFGNGDNSEDVNDVREKWKEQNDIEDTQTETDLNYLAGATNEQIQATLDIHSNYLQDSETRAWTLAESKMISAMKEAQENNENITESELREIGRNAIKDYYARMQISLVEVYEAGLINSKYIYEVAEMEDGLSGTFVTMNGEDWEGNTYNTTTSLANSSNYSTFGWEKPDAKGNIQLGDVIYDVRNVDDSFENSSFPDWNKNGLALSQSTDATHENYSMAMGGQGGSDRTSKTFSSGQEVVNMSFWVKPKFMEYEEGNMEFRFRKDSATHLNKIDFINNSTHTYIEVTDSESSSHKKYLVANLSKEPSKIQSDSWYFVKFDDFDYEDSSMRLTVKGENVYLQERVEIFQNPEPFDQVYIQIVSNYYTGNTVLLDQFEINRNISKIDSVYTFPQSDDLSEKTIMEFQPFRDRYRSINETAIRLSENWDKYATQTYQEYQAGNMTNLSDYVSASTLAQEYQQKYNETGYWGYAMAYLAANGLETPNLNNTSMMYIEYEENGTTKSTQGMLMSQGGPTYQDANYTNGTWYTGMEYNAQEIPGMQIIVPTESDEMIELDGNFTITRMLDKEGEDINSSTTKEYVYKTANTSELQALQEDLTDLRQELEDREPKVGGTLEGDDTFNIDLGGIGDAISNAINGITDTFGKLFSYTIAGLPIALIIVLIVGILLITN